MYNNKITVQKKLFKKKHKYLTFPVSAFPMLMILTRRFGFFRDLADCDIVGIWFLKIQKHKMDTYFMLLMPWAN